MRAGGFEAELKAYARELGFPALGIAPIVDSAHPDAFAQWLARGCHGEMAYLLRTADQRLSLTRYLPWAKTAIVAAWPQGSAKEPSAWPALPGRVARYALGEDYHGAISMRLERLLAWVRTKTGREVAGRVCVDTGPVLERELAARAGVGWAGKNGSLVVPGLGSFVCLGELFLDLALPPDSPIEERCGTCHACLDACPTQAFLAPRVLDARRCVSYLTTQARGAIRADLRPPIGLHVFGCDACQEVCPHNAESERGSGQDPGAPGLRWGRGEELSLLQMGEGQFREAFRASPMRFVRRSGLVRNACVVLGNGGSRAHGAVLGRLLRDDPEALVRGHAAWALGRIGGSEAEASLQEAAQRERDAEVIREVRAALASRPYA